MALVAFVCGQLTAALTACAIHATKAQQPPAAHPRYYMPPADATDLDFFCWQTTPTEGHRCISLGDLREMMRALRVAP